LQADRANDTLISAAGVDELDAGPGLDSLSAGPNDDRLFAKVGDTLDGGEGADAVNSRSGHGCE
jgi:Ca2+-binding RTX toxin-like protein